MKVTQNGVKIIFDDYCQFCLRFVALLKQLDRRGKFIFLKGSQKSTQHFLEKHAFYPFNSIIVIHKEKYYQKGMAIRQIGLTMGLGVIVKVIPLFVLDFVYMQIANRRSAISKFLFAKQKCDCAGN